LIGCGIDAEIATGLDMVRVAGWCAPERIHGPLDSGLGFRQNENGSPGPASHAAAWIEIVIADGDRRPSEAGRFPHESSGTWSIEPPLSRESRRHREPDAPDFGKHEAIPI